MGAHDSVEADVEGGWSAVRSSMLQKVSIMTATCSIFLRSLASILRVPPHFGDLSSHLLVQRAVRTVDPDSPPLVGHRRLYGACQRNPRRRDELGSYWTLQRRWEDGDIVEITLPMEVRTEAMPDDPSRATLFYGPLVLGGALGTDGLLEGGTFAASRMEYLEEPAPPVPVLVADPSNVEDWVVRVDGQPVTFRTDGVGQPKDVTLRPFYQLHHHRFKIYCLESTPSLAKGIPRSKNHSSVFSIMRRSGTAIAREPLGGRISQCLFFCAVLLAIGGLFSATWGEGTQDRDSRAPDFALGTLDGDRFQLREHRGEVVVLNFWATWCPPCRREIPEFVNLQQEHGGDGLQFVGVALQPEVEKESVETFGQQVGINYPVGLDHGSIARKYGGVRSLPTTFIIGPNGDVRDRFPGIAQWSRLLSELEGLFEDTR